MIEGFASYMDDRLPAVWLTDARTHKPVLNNLRPVLESWQGD